MRRDIARYHNRLGVSADLRRRLGLHEPGQQPESADSIVDVAFADTEAKQIKLTWADDRSGRLVMDDDGRVLKLVVLGAQGRDWETARELFQKYDCVDDVAKKLQERSAVLRSPD
ncbi:hypothetical protein CDD83_6503 [Cordyceps sp. RAO-2017]|nr:hypothetical protein CDD83_6503 [Cordyceps sp. RAO-2017]